MAKKLGTLKVKRLFLGKDSGNRGTEVTSSAAELNALDGNSVVLASVTSTAAELNYLDGSVVANSGTSVAAMLDAGGFIQNPNGAGTLPTGVTATEYGNGIEHTTRLVLTAVAIPAIAAGGANAAYGQLIYTFPATGAITVHSASMNIGITTEAATQGDTPDVGLGSVTATGVVATLDGTAAFEDILTGQTWAATMDGTAQEGTGKSTAALVESATNKIFFNWADGFHTTGSAVNTITGVIFVTWSQHRY